MDQQYQVGEHYKEFEVTKVVPLHEIGATLLECTHVPTGAQVMHIANDDPENVFCLSFQTLPKSSDGVAHILEHTVLCGSKKFPVKDPFFAMTRRSLNTYMNALTGADFTCYPAASQVPQDFYNLLEVYLDAVFYPKLNYFSFLQEGRRIELSDRESPDSPLVYKGIVFNEMKGAMASPDARLWDALMRALLPDTPYAHNSGGDPKVIPDLTFDQLNEFHKTYYHPARCLFFFYGNMPLEKHLDFLSDKALHGIEPLPALPPITEQTRFEQPKHISLPYPSHGETDKQTYIAFSFLTAKCGETEELLALALLDTVLMETDASPLKKALQDSKLCVQADGILETDMQQAPYTIVCRGCDLDAGDKLESCMKSALNQIIEKKLSKDVIEGALHQLEFNRLEITDDYGPFGLTLFMRAALGKQHGCEAENALTIYSQFKQLREKCDNPEFLPNLIRKYLLNNAHYVRLTLEPDNTLKEQDEQEEKEKLAHIKEKFTQIDLQKVLKEMQDLNSFQAKQEKQSLDCLPKVTLEDVAREVIDFPLFETTSGDLNIYHHKCFTNHIVYADLLFDLPHVQEEDLPYVKLLTSILTELGSGDRDYTENLTLITEYTGGIDAYLALHPQHDDTSQARPQIGLRGKALSRNKAQMFDLMEEFALSPRFDEKERIKELILQIASSMKNRLDRNALSYAIKLSLSGFSSHNYLNHILSGLKYYHFIEHIASNIDKELPKVLDKLEGLKETLFHLSNPSLVLSCDQADYDEIAANSFYRCDKFPKAPFTPWQGDIPFKPTFPQARTIHTPVAFSALAFKSLPPTHPDSPALSIACRLFENKVLHPKIREEGGAYGSGASFNPVLETFYFYAYRDPHIAASFDAMTHALEQIGQGQFDARDLEEAQLGMIQRMDTPISPGSRAITAYDRLRQGKTKTVRQRYRDTILSLSTESVKTAVEKHLMSQKDSGVAVTFAGKELLDKEKENLEKIRQNLTVLSV